MKSILSIEKLTASGLSRSVKVWFITVFIGQFIFATYICLQYAFNLVSANVNEFNETSTGGYIEGDLIGNISFIIHVLLALIITVGGPLQLIPSVRQQYPRFHRMNGRIYIASAFVISLVGFYLIWVRGTVGDTLAHLMTSTNGIIIMVTAFFTLRNAMLRKIKQHNQWAVRLFLAMSGVFFFRIFLNFWLIVSGGAGIDFDSFTGLPLDLIGFCSYIAPQLVFELYNRSFSTSKKWVMMSLSSLTVVLILIFIIGIVGASFLMWWPAVVG